MFGMGTGGTSPSLPPVNFRAGFVLSLPLCFLLAFLSIRLLSASLPFFPEPSACCYLLLFARFASFLSFCSAFFRPLRFCSGSSAPLAPFLASLLRSLPFRSASFRPLPFRFLPFASLPFPQLSLRSSGCFQLCTFQCTLTTAQIGFNTSDLTIDLIVSLNVLHFCFPFGFVLSSA